MMEQFGHMNVLYNHQESRRVDEDLEIRKKRNFYPYFKISQMLYLLSEIFFWSLQEEFILFSLSSIIPGINIC